MDEIEWKGFLQVKQLCDGADEMECTVKGFYRRDNPLRVWMKGNGKCLNFCFKSVREWKIEGCLKFVENAMGDCNRKRGRGMASCEVWWVSSFLDIIWKCKHYRVERARREECAWRRRLWDEGA